MSCICNSYYMVENLGMHNDDIVLLFCCYLIYKWFKWYVIWCANRHLYLWFWSSSSVKLRWTTVKFAAFLSSSPVCVFCYVFSCVSDPSELPLIVQLMRHGVCDLSLLFISLLSLPSTNSLAAITWNYSKIIVDVLLFGIIHLGFNCPSKLALVPSVQFMY